MNLAKDLDYIERCGDCADFLVIGFIRLLYNYEISNALKERVKGPLSFRYWMGEEGNDGMCFWSENHALMFYGAQLVIGNVRTRMIFYPQRTDRTGTERDRRGPLPFLA